MGMWSEFQNLFLPPFITEERSPYEPKEPKEPKEFFADCGDDVLAIIEKWSAQPEPKAISFYEMHIYMTNKIIANQASVIAQQNKVILDQAKYIEELLLTHKGSAAVSKTEKEGSSPFDSANPPVGAS